MSRKSRLSKEISKSNIQKNVQQDVHIPKTIKVEEDSKLKVYDTFDSGQQYQLSMDLLMISTMNNL